MSAFGMGLPEILIILAIFILLFGGKRIGSMMTGVGESIREFKKATKEAKDAEREIKKG